MREEVLALSVRPRMIAAYLGRLMLVTGLLMLAPAFFSLIEPVWSNVWRYGLTALTMMGIGFLLQKHVLLHQKDVLQSNEAMVIVSLIFIIMPVVYAIPMSANGVGYLAAFFQIISDITTTGMEVLPRDNLPVSFWLTSAWLQWIGGLGITVLSLGLVSSQMLNIRRLSGVLDGDSQQQQVRITDYVHRVLIAYFFITLATFLALLGVGVSVVQSAILSMAAVATGWCAPASMNINNYNFYMQIIIAVASISGAVTIGSYVLLYQKRWRDFIRDIEFLLLLFFIAIGTAIIGLTLYFSGIPLFSAFFRAFLLATSAQTTSGFTPVNLNTLSSFVLVVLIMLMFIGGSVGSTAGGIKLVRAWLTLKIVAHLIRSTRMPMHVVNPLRMEGRTVPVQVLLNTLAIIMLTLLIMTLSWLVFLVFGYPALPSIFNVVSAISTVGLSAGMISVSTPTVLKLVLCADMLFGRLEFVALLVLLAPRTWFGRRAR